MKDQTHPRTKTNKIMRKIRPKNTSLVVVLVDFGLFFSRLALFVLALAELFCFCMLILMCILKKLGPDYKKISLKDWWLYLEAQFYFLCLLTALL